MFISQNHDTLYTLTHQPPISHPPWLVDMVALMALDDLVALMAVVVDGPGGSGGPVGPGRPGGPDGPGRPGCPYGPGC